MTTSKTTELNMAEFFLAYSLFRIFGNTGIYITD